MSKENSTRSVARVISILNCFSIEQPELSTAQIVEKTNIPVATTYRILNGLREGHFLVKKRISGKYSIGPELYLLGNLFLNTTDPLSVAGPIAKLLNDLTTEVVALGIHEDAYVTIVMREESRHSLRFGVHVGSIFPTHIVAMGKAFLSELPEEDIDKIYPDERLKVYTPKTVATKTELRKELEEVRKNGIAFEREEVMEGIESMGAVIRNDTGNAILGLAIGIPIVRMNQVKRERYAQLAKMATSLASYQLGYRNEKSPVKSIKEIQSWWHKDEDNSISQIIDYNLTATG